MTRAATLQVPIFEAKVLGDLRVVYQIDLQDASHEEKQQQIIKIWGIETHASIDKRLWAAVSKHFMRRGKEYRKRCVTVYSLYGLLQR